MHRTRRLTATFLMSLAAAGGFAWSAGPAAAAEPIMPLDQVKQGMHCTARSVVKGTDIATFDVEILDVVAGDATLRQPYILFRASGPAIDATGIGPGFSGSPISCPDAQGTLRVAGAISEGIGEYGNKTALATPIELILGEPVDPPAETRMAPALVRAARPLATPLSIGGLSAPVADALRIAAHRTGHVVYASPPAPSGPSFPVQTLQGGSAMAVGLVSGDVSAGAIGTVAYVDGDKVWSFGHPLDDAGRRALFLQDAYVYSIINNPLGSGDLTTYKYAAQGHDLGTLTNDAASAVVGRLGPLPPRFPLKVTGRDLDSGRTTTSTSFVADESALGLPTGASALTQVGGLAISEVAFDLLQGLPLHQSGTMCVRIGVIGLRTPMRFCNDYHGGSSAGPGAAMTTDFTTAASQLDAFKFGPLRISGVTVDLALRRSLRQAYLLQVKAPKRVRRGRTATVTIVGQRVNGPRFTRRFGVRIPRTTPLGPRRLLLLGSPADGDGALSDALSVVLDLGSSSSAGPGDGGTGPRTLKALAKGVAQVHRYDGVTVSLPALGASTPDASGGGGTGPEAAAVKAYRDPELRLSGLARTIVRVTR